MVDISPYRRQPTKTGRMPDINERLGRWLEELRRKVNTSAAIGNVDGGTVGDSVYAVRTLDNERAATIIPVADSELTLSLGAASLWAIEGALKVSGADAEGFKFRFTGPVNFEIEYQTTDPDTGTTVESDLTVDTDADITDLGTDQIIKFSGVMRTDVVTTFSLLWAQVVSGATPVTLREGSWLRVTRLTGSSTPLVDTFELLMTGHAPSAWWKCRDVASPLVDAIGGNNLPQNGTPLYQDPGLLGGSQLTLSVGLDGISDAFGVGANGDPSIAATGTFGFLFKSSGITDTDGIVMTHGNSGGAFTFLFDLNAATEKIRVRWVRFGGVNEYTQVVNSPAGLLDGVAHTAFFTQAADGTGIQIYLDGTLVPGANITETLLGTATRDEWFGSMAAIVGVDRFRIGQHQQTVGGFNFEGNLEHISILDTNVLSAAEIAALHVAFIG